MMRLRTVLTSLLIAFACFVLMPTKSYGQSAIAGVVRDSTGAVLPGVTVRAESPELIEKFREVTTDGGGQYRIADVRPGRYTMTFTLNGFNTVHQEAVDVPTNFTVPVDAQLSVGSTTQTVEVSGSIMPVIDVQNVQQQEVLTRQELDDIPTPRNIQAVATTALGVKNSRPDVGGSEGMQLTHNVVFGSEARDLTLEIDGMLVTSPLGGGCNFAVYHNDGEFQEVTDQTAGMPADVKAGGIFTNMIPREGGNQFHGAIFAAYSPGSIQSNNFDSNLAAHGLTTAPNIAKIWDYNGSVGGPIIKDRLWFFSTYRYWGVDQHPTASVERTPDPAYPIGSVSLDDSWLQSLASRLTAQITPKNKFTVSWDYLPKWRGHRSIGAGVEPRASFIQTTPISYVTQAKWTGTLSSKLLVQAGISVIAYNTNFYPQPGLTDAAPPQMNIDTGEISDSFTSYKSESLYMVHPTASLSYVTGSHSIKVGYEPGFGIDSVRNFVLGNVLEEFKGGLPFAVAEENTPLVLHERINHDDGIFALDQWTHKRFTLTGGLRIDHFNSSLDSQDAPANQWLPARSFPQTPNLPNWWNYSWRSGAAWDVFGDARKVVVKVGVNKYVRNEGVGFSAQYNPLALAPTKGAGSDVRTWLGQPNCFIGTAVPCQVNMAFVGPDQNVAFGASTNRVDNNVVRPYHLEYTADVTHEFARGWAVDVGYFRRGYHRLIGTLAACNSGVIFNGADCSNKLLNTLSGAYTSANIVSPLDGSTITVYNQAAALVGKTHSVDYTSPIDTRTYNGFSVGVHGRFAHGILFGGMQTGRTVANECDQTDPNLQRFCDQSGLGIPFDTQYKLGGTYNFPLGLKFSGLFTSYAGDAMNATLDGGLVQDGEDPSLQDNLTISKAMDPGLTQTAFIVPLIAPGSHHLPRLTQLDIRLAKVIHLTERYTLEGDFDVFNSLNANTIFTSNQAFGASYGNATGVVQGRIFRFGAQFKF